MENYQNCIAANCYPRQESKRSILKSYVIKLLSYYRIENAEELSRLK